VRNHAVLQVLRIQARGQAQNERGKGASESHVISPCSEVKLQNTAGDAAGT
jgi:hypothetical protein